MGKTNFGNDDAAPQKKTLFTYTFSDAQIEKLREICLEKSDFEATQVQYSSFSGRLKARGVVVTVYPKRNRVVISGGGAAEFVEFEIEPKILFADGVPGLFAGAGNFSSVPKSGGATGNFDDATAAAAIPEKYLERHAGLDESGKGDLFGVPVAACVIVGGDVLRRWVAAGVKDCKAISSDKKIAELAAMIRAEPEAIVRSASTRDYNASYARYGNLDLLLTALHFRALQSALDAARETSAGAPAHGLLDQFSREPHVQHAIEAAGIDFDLEMRPHGEDDPVVAAASIVARAEFLANLNALSERAGMTLPKGCGRDAKAAAVKIFKKFGEARAAEFIKMHFKTAAEAAEIAASEP